MTIAGHAPLFSLSAVSSGRVFRLIDYRGRPVLLLFVDHNTGRSTREVVIAVRRRYPNFTALPIAIVVDLRIVPRLLRKTAERIMETAYRSAADDVPAGFDPSEHLILLPDWTGEIATAYHAGDVSRYMHLVAVAPDGMIHDTYQGSSPAQQAVNMLAPLMEKSG